MALACYFFYKHIGLYAYTKDFLFTFTNLPASSLEAIEGLEQLRVLENGYKIKTVETKFDTVGIDRPEDLKKALVLGGKREAMVLQLYFVEELNLEEIGQTLGIGAARVCQIKKSALDKLRGSLKDWG